MSSRRLITLVKNSSNSLPANKKFLNDVMRSIELVNQQERRKGSNWYKPSSLKCMRNMYFTRLGVEQDVTPTDYNSTGMADTGTDRHERIQHALMNMKSLGFDWEYVDVARYVEKKQKEGKCLTLVVRGQQGAETLLFDSALKISFKCDGIIRRVSTNEYYLFEFKNVISFKYSQVEKEPLHEHHNQVICYCTALDLDKAFVLYENRDNCSLECPSIFEVTKDMKKWLCDYIYECEGYVERMIAPPKTDDKKTCRWCAFKTICGKV